MQTDQGLDLIGPAATDIKQQQQQSYGVLDNVTQ